eukprot:COSAG05_NODE_2583_length_2873_cov_359.798116_2_plen_87_part_00
MPPHGPPLCDAAADDGVADSSLQTLRPVAGGAATLRRAARQQPHARTAEMAPSRNKTAVPFPFAGLDSSVRFRLLGGRAHMMDYYR